MENSPIVDADGHVLEPIELWEQYLEDPKWLPLGPRFFNDEDGEQHFMLEGEVLTKKGGLGLGGRNVRQKWDSSLRKQRWEEQEPGGFDPGRRVADMDEEGVDMVLLYPTIGLRFTALKDADLSAALCRAYNRWLVTYCKPHPHRLFGVGIIPLQEPALAVQELRYAVEQCGFKGVLIRPNPIRSRNLDHPDYYPVWQAAQDLDCVIALHEGGNVRNNPQVGRDRFDNWAYIHAVAHPMEMQMALMCFAFGGVFEKFPKLKIMFLESGGGWLPFWLERLDEHFEKLDWLLPQCKRPPNEYFKRQCMIQVEADESTLPMTAELVSGDCIVWGSDYPHYDCNWLGAVEKVRMRQMPQATTRKILGENAVRIFNLPKIERARPPEAEKKVGA
ncbi:MAG TPA: amidohydrolase family protein [Terriglobia bacterium]|nr:amidohydrolase family protein [Terriglobia bacterium]